MNEAETAQYLIERDQTASAAAARYGVGFDDLMALCCFLAERWADWRHDGRPLVADEYKRYLGQAVLMARIVGNRTYDNVRNLIGSRGGYFGPILDEIFPDWGETEKDRARRTLKAMIRNPIGPKLEVAETDVDAFVDFLDRRNLHSFFWRLRSFEDHALRGNEFATPGMHSDVQGMAVVVEHIMRALGGTKEKLYEMFKEIWTDAAVIALLKRTNVARLARQKTGDWTNFMKEINTLRQGSAEERLVADLVLAYRIRGAVHHELPESDPWALEDLFATLMRAAARTFVHTRA